SSINTGEVVESQYSSLGILFHNADFQNLANNFPSSAFPGHSLPNMMFVIQGGGSQIGAGPLNIELSVPVNRIGMYVSGSVSVTYTIKVYGASGLLETLIKPGIEDGVGTHTYVGLQRPELITRAEVFCTSDSACYANCDNSTNPPILNANDFQCFL